MQIQEITNTLSKNYEIDNLTKKTWDLFVNHIFQYKSEYNRIKRYHNNSLLIDFHRRSFEVLKSTNENIKKLNLSDKQLESNIKIYVNNLIDQFLKFNMESVKSLEM